MRGSARRAAIVVGSGVAVALVACALAVDSATARELGARPLPGEFRGRFAGPGGASTIIALEVRSVSVGPTSVRTGLRSFDGVVPATCVKDGRTRVAGRDGAIGIQFSLNNRLRVHPEVELHADGNFAFRMEHKAEDPYDEAYSIAIRGTFGRKAVSGRVQGTSVSTFVGKCRANRTFTARLLSG